MKNESCQLWTLPIRFFTTPTKAVLMASLYIGVKQHEEL